MIYIDDLTTDQKYAFEQFISGKNVFITGPAGTGKTYLIRKIRSYCYKIKKYIGITALTGCAAYIIHGHTLHSWAGIGLGEDPIDILVKKVKKNRRAYNRWKKTEVLVIDEISMMSKGLFIKLEKIARIIRKNDKVWGGLQICALGDMCQLPPCNADFCFESKKWNKTFGDMIQLTTIKRQQNDDFCDCLNEIRFGIVSNKTKELLKQCSNKTWDESHPVKPTRLYGYNNKVDEINKKEHQKLNTDKVYFEHKTNISYYEYPNKALRNQAEYQSKMMDKNISYDPKLELSIGAQVMLLTNIDVKSGLVNGSRGVVKMFDKDGLPVVHFLHGIDHTVKHHDWTREETHYVITKTQIPLKLAWATSIHRTQGATLDLVEVDVKNIFEYGQVYVALSRVKNKDSLYIKDYDIKKIKCHPKVKEFYKKT